MNNGWEFRMAAVLICLQAVIVVSLFWGRVPGIVGAFSAGMIFYVWLFPPVGTLVIEHPSDRLILLLFQLAGLGIVFLSPRSPVGMSPLGGRNHRLISRKPQKRQSKTSD
jgi:K+-sensing histidine kinase KdpD